MDGDLIARLTILASLDPTTVSRDDLLNLIEMAGLAGSALHDLVRGHARQYITVRAAVVRMLLARVPG